MQVKKFEAKTMQDALSMVKKDLGPEAIILAAKDNKGNFGLAGETSVEVTAAVSGHKLREHQFAMAKLRDSDRDQVLNSSAINQKKFIQKSVSRYNAEQPQSAGLSTSRGRRYIDIDEDEARDIQVRSTIETATPSQTNQSSQANYLQQGNLARVKQVFKEKAYEFDQNREAKKVQSESAVQQKSERVSAATKDALEAFSKDWAEDGQDEQQLASAAGLKPNQEIMQLKMQIEQLQSVISGFKQVPQSFLASHPGAEFHIPYELSANYQFLLKRGIDQDYAVKLSKFVQEELDRSKWPKKPIVDACIAKELIRTIRVKSSIENGVHIFMGTSGSGKTSSLIKMAARLVVGERKKVAILTTDTLKVGASEQLKVYAKILNVPFGVIRKGEDWPKVLSALSDMDCILVDTPGLALRNLEEIETLKASLPDSIPTHSHVHLVQPVTMKNSDAEQYAEKYKIFNFEDIIFTKLDESVQHGLIYNQSQKFNVPILGFGVGSNIPEDFEFASVERMLDLLFKLSTKKETR